MDSPSPILTLVCVAVVASLFVGDDDRLARGAIWTIVMLAVVALTVLEVRP